MDCSRRVHWTVVTAAMIILLVCGGFIPNGLNHRPFTIEVPPSTSTDLPPGRYHVRDYSWYLWALFITIDDDGKVIQWEIVYLDGK